MVMGELCPLPTADCLFFWRPTPRPSHISLLLRGIRFHPWPEVSIE